MSNKFPPQLVKKLGENPLFDTQAFLETHDADTSVTTIRLHPQKITPDWISTNWNRVPWCEQGVFLPERPKFTADPFFHAGVYYVQEASSMFLAHVIKSIGYDKKPGVVVDLCAAPGGKSTLLLSIIHEDSLLIANELIKSRVGILEENITRWGYANYLVSHSDPSAFGRLGNWVDVLVVDAPCSGSGMFRKDEDAISEWSEATVKLCSERQQRILASSLNCLKPGGYLIYSTCSYSEEENEQMADWLMDKYDLKAVQIETPGEWKITTTLSEKHACPGYRFYPHIVQGEGFFLTVFQKNGDVEEIAKPKNQRKNKDKGSKGKNNPRDGGKISKKTYSKWVDEEIKFHAFMVGEQLHLIPERHQKALTLAQQFLYLKSAGLRVGKMHKGEVLIPDHALAMSLYRHTAIPTLELDINTALDYLRKNSFSHDLESEAPHGWCIAIYKGAALGWVKVMPGRINNYYPKESRIYNL